MEIRRKVLQSEAINELHHQFPRLTFLPVGSRVTCDPAPEGTDQDWLVYADGSDMARLRVVLVCEDWTPCGDEEYDDRDSFRAYRKGEDNLIVTDDRVFYDSFKAGTRIAERLNLLEKEDRVALFEELRKYWPKRPIYAEPDIDDTVPF